MNRIKELRKNKKLTQEELASKIGTTKLTVSNWENGKHEPKYEKAQQLADYFGVTVGYLLGYDSLISPDLVEQLEGVRKDLEKAKQKNEEFQKQLEAKGRHEVIMLCLLDVFEALKAVSNAINSKANTPRLTNEEAKEIQGEMQILAKDLYTLIILLDEERDNP